MAKTTTSLAIWGDNPPYFRNEILENLEEMSNTSVQTAQSLQKNFQNIATTQQQVGDKIASVIADEAERTRLQQSIENERIANGISETNYKLQDISYGMEELNANIESMGENVVQAISKMSSDIVEELEESNYTLHRIEKQLEIVNASLQFISNQLGSLLKFISKPNETEALELADQARQNIALGKKDKALEITQKALELSNGTSITVLAYRILTLSLFDDENLKKEIIEQYDDYVSLVSFKLLDARTDKEQLVSELFSTLFPVMATMGYYIKQSVSDNTLKLYGALYQQRAMLSTVLLQPITSQNTLEMILSVNPLREMHWSILLTKSVVQERNPKYYLAYVNILSNSKVLIKNELLILAVKHMYEEGFLYALFVDALAGNSDEKVADVLEVVLALLPQDVIKIDDKTYWAMQQYILKQSITPNKALQKELEQGVKKVDEHIYKEYTAFYDRIKQTLQEEQDRFSKQRAETIQKNENELNVTIEETNQFNNDLENKYIHKLISDKESLYALDWSSGWVATILIVILITLWIKTSDNMFNVPFGKNPFAHIWDAIKVIFWFAVGVPLLNGIIKGIQDSYQSYLRKNIRHYEVELIKQKNVTKIKENLQNQHSQTMETLTKEYDDYVEKQVNTLQERLNFICTAYHILEKDKSFTDIDMLNKYLCNELIEHFPNELLNFCFDTQKPQISMPKKRMIYTPIDIDENTNSYNRYKDKNGEIYILTEEGIMREGKIVVSYNYKDSMVLIKKGKYTPA